MRRFAFWLGNAAIVFALSGLMLSGINAAAGGNSARPSSSAAGSSSQSERPSWCQKGWECLPTSELADTTRLIIDLREQVLRARGKRLGWTIGPSLGVAAVVTDQFDVKFVPAAGFSLTFGWRSK